MRSELIELHRRLGATMIYVTHDQVEAMTLAHRIVVMNAGVVQQYGRPLDLYDDPDNRFVAGFIGSPKMNFLDASVGDVGPDHVTLTGIGGSGYSLNLPFRGFDAAVSRVVVGVRPEHVRLVADSADGLAVKVSFAEELGDVTYVHGKSPDGNSLIIRSDRARHDGAENCVVALNPSGLRLFDAGGRRLRENGT
jgi:lactose/L-arabinose transport system ATP-binding protein